MIAHSKIYDSSDFSGSYYTITSSTVTAASTTTGSTDSIYCYYTATYIEQAEVVIELGKNFRWWHVFKVKKPKKILPFLFTNEFKNRPLRIQSKKCITKFRKHKRKMFNQKNAT